MQLSPLPYIIFFLKKHIKKLTDEDSVRASNWTVAGYTLLGLVSFMLVTFLIVITEPPFKGESVKVGETDNEIYYQKASISKNDIQVLADNLYDLGYFREETSNAVLITRNKEGYTVTIPTNKSVWDNLGIEYSVIILKKELILIYSSPITIVLEDYDMGGAIELLKSFSLPDLFIKRKMPHLPDNGVFPAIRCSIDKYICLILVVKGSSIASENTDIHSSMVLTSC